MELYAYDKNDNRGYNKSNCINILLHVTAHCREKKVKK